MKQVGLATAVLLAFAVAGHPEAPKTKTPAKAVYHAAADLKWVEQAGVPVKTSVLWGDPAKGEHGALHRFPAGFAAPMHSHTCDHNVVVVSGNITLGGEGEAATTLGPGSHFAFTGMKKHTTRCEDGADCVLFVDCAGKWDVVMDEPAKK